MTEYWTRKNAPVNPPEPPAKTWRVPRPFPSGATEALWFDNPMYQNEMKGLAESAIFKHFQSVIINSIPQGFPPGSNITDVQAIREMGRMDGWREVVNLIDRMIHFKRVDQEEAFQPLNTQHDYARDDHFKL